MNKIKLYSLIFSLGLFGFIISSGNYFDTSILTFSNKNVPFPPASEISDKKKELRVGIERIVKDKYYITYSKVEGNRSYLGTYLIVENLQQKSLDKKGLESILIIDNLGNKYKPLPYQKILDFPEDHPLGWKLIIFNKFPPLNKKASFINIYVNYSKERFVLEKVPLP